MSERVDAGAWRCPDCPWEQRAHPVYGWRQHDDRAVEIHQLMLCPSRDTACRYGTHAPRDCPARVYALHGDTPPACPVPGNVSPEAGE